MTSTTSLQHQPHPQRRRTTMMFPTLVSVLFLFSLATIPPSHHVANASSPPAVSLLPTAPTPDTQAGPIDDTQCNIEELEQANDSQLYTILQELVLRTEFFQHFAVDLEQTCPLSKDEEEEFECSGPGESDTEATSALPDVFGGGEEDHGAGGCKVEATEEEDNPFGGFGAGSSGSSPTTQPQSQALYDLSQQGFASKEQAGAFQWKQQTNKIVTPSDSPQGYSLSHIKSEEDCLELDADHNKRGQQWLPETFWMDMCSHVSSGQSTKIVNLALNPERNTGYNGTHLWNAIYQENCINIDSKNSASTSSEVLPFPTPGKVVQPTCFEERVLYRLLSGLHTSTTISIAKNYYMPSKRKGRTTWQPNPQFFMDHFQSHPEYIRNLHFSYVVLLRALKKATPFLYNYEIRTGNPVDDEAGTILLRRLLDSSILHSCSSVFGAFDETLMFRQADTLDGDENGGDNIALQQSFKGVFHNISSILDCVQCQQCKLHGKLAMLGYGTALKILFIKPSALQLERNEIVAFINTLAKLSESIRDVRELTHLYWMEEQAKQQAQQDEINMNQTTTTSSGTSAAPSGDTIHMTKAGWDSWNNVDGAIGAIAALQRQGLITVQQETHLIMMAIETRDPSLLILTKHYFSSPNDSQADLIKLRDLLQSRGLLDGSGTALSPSTIDPLDNPDAIVVGSGLAGLAAALNILDRGGYVVLLEKEHLLGGNSNKASSGINACCPNTTQVSPTPDDSVEVFVNDTIRSAGTAARPDLIQVLVSNSASAVEWLQSRVGVDLSLKAQLGGHSSKRTHRPSNGMAGAEIIYGMQKAVKNYVKQGKVKILVDTKVTQLITEHTADSDGKFNEKTVVGVECENIKDGDKQSLKAPHVIMATGGFASDRRPKESYLSQYRPELLQFPTTAGPFSTGDGIALATSLGADTISMDQVQIHPTGWVDPTDPKNPSKILAAELMRGVGGILLNDKGQRFCNELGTRAYVTDKMLQHNWRYYMTSKWDANAEIPTFALILSSAAAEDAKKHVDLYSHKGLLNKLEGVGALAEWMGQSEKTVKTAIEKYKSDAKAGKDEFAKRTFRGVFADDLQKEVFYAGRVTPVLHYCMGGITIDADGNVLDTERRIIPGLHAAGEVTGGVHGNNRLAGNSLLECTVFGSLVGRNLPLQERQQEVQSANHNKDDTAAAKPSSTDNKSRQVTMEELAEHNTPEDCWVAIHGVVYDLTEFAEEHPAGPESIRDLAGQDGTEAFAAVHNKNILDDFDDDRIGVLVSS